MKILLDPGVYDMRNKGNVAMLQAAALRFRQCWPEAEIGAITLSPQILDYYCPGIRPVSVDDQPGWTDYRSGYYRLQRRIPVSLQKLLFEIREEAWRRWPGFKARLKVQLWSIAKRPAPGPRPLPRGNPRTGQSEAIDWETVRGRSLRDVDLYVATGGGYLCDIAEEHAQSVFDRLETALELGKPAVMVGAGIGPFRDPGLLRRARNILPHLDFIAVREGTFAVPFLQSIGVDRSRVMVTGDDAVEMAYILRKPRLGQDIGLNLRLMNYTGVNQRHLEVLRRVIHRVAEEHKAKLVSLPISYDLREADAEVNRLLVKGYPQKDDVSWRKFDQPSDIIERASRCRIVLTGAYHTAVFALSQGIPAICLVNSAAYREKMTGLADQFRTGCSVIDLDDPNLEENLAQTIGTWWDAADSLRPALLQSAAEQISCGWAAIRRVNDILEAYTRLTCGPVQELIFRSS